MKLLLLVLAFFAVYVGAEGTFGGWIFTYAVSLGMADRVTAAYLTSVFWGSLTLGRLLSIPLATRFRPSTILLGDLLGCLFSVALILLFPRSATIVWVGTFGAGLFMASMFPTLIAFAERRMAISGQITGFFLLASAAGGMTIPWLVGQLFERIGPRVTIVMAFASIVIALLAFSAALRIGGEAAPDAAVHREATL
jgi:FHS family Na+ dependent glucose MFS transporter 1